MSLQLAAREVTPARERVILPDGRALTYIEYGARDGVPVLHFHGWPGSACDFAPNAAVAEELGIRVIAADRPGVAGSDRRPGRSLLDWADDVDRLADALGIERFSVLGFSFGGPYAVACAYRLADRVAVAGIAGGLGWLDRPRATEGMMRPTRLNLALARRAPWLVRPLVALMLRAIARDPDRFGNRLGGDMAPADRALLAARPEVTRAIAGAAAEMARSGSGGVLDDALAITRPWRFALEEIGSPVAIWQGSEDTNVPAHMAEHYAATIPGARLIVYPGEGHMIFFSRAREILSALAA